MIVPELDVVVVYFGEIVSYEYDDAVEEDDGFRVEVRVVECFGGEGGGGEGEDVELGAGDVETLVGVLHVLAAGTVQGVGLFGGRERGRGVEC